MCVCAGLAHSLVCLLVCLSLPQLVTPWVSGLGVSNPKPQILIPKP